MLPCQDMINPIPQWRCLKKGKDITITAYMVITWQTKAQAQAANAEGDVSAAAHQDAYARMAAIAAALAAQGETSAAA